MERAWNFFYPLFILILLSLNASGIDPAFKLRASGNVIDIIKEKEHLYVATDAGTVDVINISSRRIVKNIKVPGIKDFMGDDIPAKVYSVDKFPGKDDILMVCQGESGFRNVFIYKNSLEKIIDAGKDKMMIKEARFVSPDLLLFGLTSDELILFDLNKNNIVYRKQINHYTFADMVLNEDRTKVLTSDESGIIQMFDVRDAELIKTFEGNNVDKVFQIDYKNSILIGGGQDRRLAVYDNMMNTSYYIQGNFLIYSVGLNPSGKIGAYSANEDNDVIVFDVASQNELYTLKGSVSTLTKILFYTEKELITACESEEILFWNLNE